MVEHARVRKPDLYIIVDAVQHAPHAVGDLQKMPIDDAKEISVWELGSRRRR